MASVGTLALLAGLPIAVSFGLLVGLRWSASRSMGVGWLIATALGIGYWGMELPWWAAATVYGALEAFSIILIVFGAILLMNYLELGGSISTIRWHFSGIAEDRRVQLLLIGLGFETIIEGAAGFGTPGALAAPLLIGLGFPPLGAAVFGLYFNAPNPQFGAAGTTIEGVRTVIAGVLPADMPVDTFIGLVSGWTGVFTGLAFAAWGVLGIFLLAYWFGSEDERSVAGALAVTKPVVPFAVVVGTVAGLTQFAVAWVVGPALPSVAAGFAAFGVGLALANRGLLMPENDWTFPDREGWTDTWLGGLSLSELDDGEPTREMPVWKAWAPYLLVGGVLLVTRWPSLGLVSTLQNVEFGFAVFGFSDLTWTLQPLYLPGTMPFIPVAVLTGLLYGMGWERTRDAWAESVRQVAPAALTLIVAVSLTQVMIQSAENTAGFIGMMTALSQALALAAGEGLPLVAPWIGAVGGFVTGSNTTSNILFSVLQYEAAADVGISKALIVAIQNVGGGVGNPISVLNIAAISGVIGISGREGDILRKTIVPTALFAVFTGLLGMALVYAVAPGVF